MKFERNSTFLNSITKKEKEKKKIFEIGMDPLLQSISNLPTESDRETCLIEYGSILLRPTKQKNEFQFKYFVLLPTFRTLMTSASMNRH